jgi:dTDP-4-amino-4,6-dideoxygalactose transaminase
MGALPDLGQPPAIPLAAQVTVEGLLDTGRLHRYGEKQAGPSPVAELERAFAGLIGRAYAVALNSCGSAMFLALKGAGVRAGDPVLMNAFTLGPVLGALDHVGARPVLVDISDDLVIDLTDLRAKAQASGAKVLLLSHMRGHLADMGAVMALCAELGVSVVEDCAHTLGASWGGVPTGRFGVAGCFSFQSAKHVNAGEGGVLVTDDPDIAARAILHSGSYMLYDQNGTVPPADVMARWRDLCGNYSLRMSNMVAAMALPQLPMLRERVADWNRSHDYLAARLAQAGFVLPQRGAQEAYAQSSIQFRVAGASAEQMAQFVAVARAGGVMVKWFGTARAEGYTSAPPHWAGLEATTVPNACAIQANLCDIRIPLGLSVDACDAVVDVLVASLAAMERTDHAPA